jgi:MFS family permease
VFSVKVPDWTARWGNTKLLMVGTGITALGMLWLNQYQSGYWLQVALPMVVLGIGQGMAFAPLTAAGIAGTSQADAGAASGVVNVMHQMGAAFGISLVTAVVDPIVNPVTKFNVSIMTSTILIFIVVILFTLLILPATKRKSV